ncbi:MAG: SMP-30/gluconolactonase/LRE family protein [Acidobacteriota bacterium]|nr:SMP-30/gluconolactonase/LRE family protein [Acidobacteriota bacterium]
MKRAALLALLVSLLACTTAAPPAKPFVVDDATRGAIAQLEEAVAQQPKNTPWIYILATYYDRAHDAANVVKWLTRLDELGWDHGIPPHDFRNTNTTAFRDVAARLDAREPLVHKAETAFTLANHRDLIPEGITYDPVDDVFYVSSIYHRNVVRIDRRGRATDFLPEAAHGMLSSLGMHVDAKRRLLWVASSAAEEMVGYTPELQGRSILFAFDLRDGSIVKQFAIGSPNQPSMLNDLTILADGSVLVTDTVRNQVLRTAADVDTLDAWLDDFRFPNGITATDDGKTLYVADFRGITRVSLADGKREPIETNTIMNGIDGLSMHRGNLIGIQNAIGRARVVRIGADSGRVEILESKNPLFEVPTTGVVVGDEFYFIANPGLRSFEEHKLWPKSRLKDPVMLRIPLVSS